MELYVRAQKIRVEHESPLLRHKIIILASKEEGEEAKSMEAY
jgi:hypothetical protein